MGPVWIIQAFLMWVDRRGAGLDMIDEWRRDLVQTRSFDFVMGGGDRVT